MRESVFQAKIIRTLKEQFPGAIVLKNDSGYQQGVPDLIVLFKNRWAMLELKASYLASRQPNQEYWVSTLDDMSFAAFLFPENEDAIFEELHHHFRQRPIARIKAS